MKYKMDDRFNTVDDIKSLEDFEKMTTTNIRQEPKIEKKPPENSDVSQTQSMKDLVNQTQDMKDHVNQTQSMKDLVNQTQNLQENRVYNNQNDNQRNNYRQNINTDPNGFNASQRSNNTQQIRNTQRLNSTLRNTQTQQMRNPQRNTQAQQPRNMQQRGVNNNSTPIIELKGVGLAYDRDIILNNINLTINKGDFVYLVGESGAGKSSIIKMLYREVKPNKGQILIDKQDIVKLSSSKLPKLRRKVGVIFQDYKLLTDKTIYKNVSFSLEVTGYPRKKIKEKVMETLRKVGIEDQAFKYPDELSGGQQQRAAIARAIVDDPIIIVADEPTGNLDPENALSIMELLEKINEEGTTIVMATHDVGIVNNFPKRVILLGKAKVLKESQGEYIYE